MDDQTRVNLYHDFWGFSKHFISQAKRGQRYGHQQVSKAPVTRPEQSHLHIYTCRRPEDSRAFSESHRTEQPAAPNETSEWNLEWSINSGITMG